MPFLLNIITAYSCKMYSTATLIISWYVACVVAPIIWHPLEICIQVIFTTIFVCPYTIRVSWFQTLGKTTSCFFCFLVLVQRLFLLLFFFFKKKKTFLDFKTSSLVIGKILWLFCLIFYSFPKTNVLWLLYLVDILLLKKSFVSVSFSRN
jgi:hypothetical protein